MGLNIAVEVNSQPESELAEASRVEVLDRAGEPTEFRFRYDVDIHDGDLPALVDRRMSPDTVWTLVVPAEDRRTTLVKGPVLGQNIHLKHGGGGSWLEVQGRDRSVLMDRETKIEQWSDVKDSDAVSTIMNRYGFTPRVQATDGGHYTDKHTLVQRETDLQFVNRLARRNGFQFWVMINDAGLEEAHFEPPPLDRDPERSLVINLENPNLRSLDIEWDVERPSRVLGRQLDLNSREGLEVDAVDSGQTPLGNRGLDDLTDPSSSVHLAVPADDAGNLLSRGRAVLAESTWFIRARARTTLESLGGLLRSNTPVRLQGAGRRHSGTYLVSSVRHDINAERHEMKLELIRNGWSE